MILLAAKIGGEICERYLKQPAVLGEIIFGIILGKSVLHWVPFDDEPLRHIAEIGAILLLFEVGLESDMDDLFKVGSSALYVAILGVLLPFVGGYFAAHQLGLSTTQALFIGAALTATSVGISARVFSDMRALELPEARIVLGAAVVDDVLGLIILAAVSGLGAGGTITAGGIAQTTGIALAFLLGAVIIGLKATPLLLKLARKMKTRAAVSAAAVVFCLFISSLAETAGLAPIVGAFAAGLVLNKTEDKIHFEEKIRSIADIFVPVFFVLMGVQMNLQTFNPATKAGQMTLFIGGILTIIGVLGKLLAGLMLPGKSLNKWLIGAGMIPRGEVGLIFASIGISKGLIKDDLYSAIIFVVVVTTFITPPLLKVIAKRSSAQPVALT